MKKGARKGRVRYKERAIDLSSFLMPYLWNWRKKKGGWRRGGIGVLF